MYTVITTWYKLLSQLVVVMQMEWNIINAYVILFIPFLQFYILIFSLWSPGRDVVAEMGWVEKYFQRANLQGHATNIAPRSHTTTPRNRTEKMLIIIIRPFSLGNHLSKILNQDFHLPFYKIWVVIIYRPVFHSLNLQPWHSHLSHPQAHHSQQLGPVRVQGD